MKIFYYKGNIYFETSSRNWAIPDGSEGEIVLSTLKRVLADDECFANCNTDEKFCFDCRKWYDGEHDCLNTLRR